MIKKFCQFLLIVLFSISSPLNAQSTLDRVVVTPNKRSTLVFDTLNSVEVITSEMIKKSGNVTLESILNQSSSISIGSNGGFGQTKSIFMRGTESNHTKVLVNGVELNPGTLGVPSIQHISVDLIERIEISKGSMSTLYGKNAIGGVINIITKKNFHNEVKYLTGRYGTQKISYSDGINYLKHDFNLNISRFISDSYKAKVTSSQNHKYDNANIDMAYKYNVTDQTHINLDYYRNTGNTEYDSFGSNLNQNHRDNHIKFSLNTISKDSNLDVFYVRKGNEINQAAAGATDFTHTKSDLIGLEYSLDDSDDGSILLGFNYSDESMYELSFGTSFKHSNRIREFLISRSMIYQDNLSVNLGLRFINHSVFNDYTIGNINLGYTITPDLIINASVGKSFRPPDATDLFGFSGNANLNPEKSISSEFGMKYRINNNDSLSLSIFNNEIRNLIESDGSQMQNINKARITGFELNFDKTLNDMTYKLNYTYQEADDLTNDTLLSRRPRNKISANILKNFNDEQSLSMMIRAESRKDNSIYDSHRLGGYMIIDANYIRKFNSFDVSLRLENILDKKYRLAHNYNTDGRSLFISLGSSF